MDASAASAAKMKSLQMYLYLCTCRSSFMAKEDEFPLKHALLEAATDGDTSAVSTDYEVKKKK